MAKIHEYTDSSGVKFYEFRFYAGINPQTGKPKYIHRKKFKTQKSARLALSRLQLELSQKGTIEKENNILFSQVYQEWYQEYINTVRESTYARTAGMFTNHILPIFGNKRIRTITTEQVQRAVNKWFKEVSYNYKRWYNYTVAVLDFAIKRGYVKAWATNPAKLITLPKRPDKFGDKPENFWNKEELERFFSMIDPQTEPEQFTLFRVLAFAGLRRGEVLALTWGV